MAPQARVRVRHVVRAQDAARAGWTRAAVAAAAVWRAGSFALDAQDVLDAPSVPVVLAAAGAPPEWGAPGHAGPPHRAAAGARVPGGVRTCRARAAAAGHAAGQKS